MILQKAWNEYGEDNFSFINVEYCDSSILDDRETYWISFYNAYTEGYNQTPCIGGDTLKKRLTVNIDERLIEPLKIDAIKKSKTVGDIIEELIAEYLKTQVNISDE